MLKLMLLVFVACMPVAIVASVPAFAELRPDKVHVADSKKTQAYIRDGLITGGDKAIDEVVVKDIRRASNGGYERVVIDLEGAHAGEPAAIQRPPFYQISVTPDERRIVVTLWGKPKLGFDSRRVVNAFKRSSVIQSVELLPRVEENTWSFVFGLKGESPVEVFELSNPVRIIMDVKGDAKAAAKAKSKPKAKAKPKAPHPRKLPPKNTAPVEAQPVPQGALDAVPDEPHGAEPTEEHHP
jgi:hypothetical protein